MKKSFVIIGLWLCAMAVCLGSNAVITVMPLLMPPISSPDWTVVADKAISDAQSYGLSMRRTVSYPATEYAWCGYKVSWSNLVTGAATTSPVVWQFIDLKSQSGNDDMSLDMLQFSSSSSDGVLGDSVAFTGASLTPRAITIRFDGTVIMSGPASQKGKRVLVLVSSKLFNGGDTLAGLNQVRDWLARYSDYQLWYTAQITGDASTKSSAGISTSGRVVMPTAVLNQSGMLAVINAEPTRSYLIYASPNPAPGSWWQFLGVVYGTNLVVVPNNQPAQFFKLAVQ